MKKMIISLVIEAKEEDLNTIKGNIIDVACESIVSCSCNTIEEPVKELKVPEIQAGVFVKC